jgi:hypothetical protein
MAQIVCPYTSTAGLQQSIIMAIINDYNRIKCVVRCQLKPDADNDYNRIKCVVVKPDAAGSVVPSHGPRGRYNLFYRTSHLRAGLIFNRRTVRA